MISFDRYRTILSAELLHIGAKPRDLPSLCLRRYRASERYRDKHHASCTRRLLHTGATLAPMGTSREVRISCVHALLNFVRRYFSARLFHLLFREAMFLHFSRSNENCARQNLHRAIVVICVRIAIDGTGECDRTHVTRVRCR